MSKERVPKTPTSAFSQYSLSDFQATYDLSQKEAKELFSRFGPSKSELDVLMTGIRNKGQSAMIWLA